MKLDILVEQTFLWKEENKLQKRWENLPTTRTNVVVFTKNRKFKFLQDGNAELWRDPAAVSCESRRFVLSFLFTFSHRHWNYRNFSRAIYFPLVGSE